MNSWAQQVEAKLFSLTTKGIKFDLERIRFAAAEIGNAQNSCCTIHVAGTNGKGSTCAFIESALRCAGYRTALFTSPHIVSFAERFRIDGNIVTEKQWLDVYDDLAGIISSCRLTFFEAATLIAFELFRRERVEWAVYETGMGGRLDATNIINPALSVITRVAMDHREYLGESLEEIMGEKLGIVKPKTPLVIADPLDEGLRQVVRNRCEELQAPCTMVNLSQIADLHSDESKTAFVRKGVRYELSLAGDFQAGNALLSIEALEHCGVELTNDGIYAGLRNARVSGRFDHFDIQGKRFIFDVGHNPDAAALICAQLSARYPKESLCIVTGIMADKEYSKMVSDYALCANHVIAARPKIARAARSGQLAACMAPEQCTVCSDVASAIDAALLRKEGVICVTGSFHTVGEAFIALGIRPL